MKVQRRTTTRQEQDNRARRLIRMEDGKLYDFGTNNRSFIQVAQDLHRLGIKNCYFMLEVFDPRVVNIDPYAVDLDGHCALTKEQINIVMTECRANPWYFLREVSRIPDQGGTSVPYRANRGNIAQAWCIFHGYDSWLCLPRQKGKTMSALAAESWGYNFGTTNSSFIFINKDGPLAKKNLWRLRNLNERLPEYMQFDMFVDETGKKTVQRKNATELRHAVNGNSVAVTSKATSYDKALSMGRGLDAPILHFDEPEFTDFIDVIVENSVSTYEQAAKNAAKNGAMHARIFTCTPRSHWALTSLIAGKFHTLTLPN